MARDINVVLRRTQFAETYSAGELAVNGWQVGRTLEYPWRGNMSWQASQSRVVNSAHTSCVREGIYRAELRSDHKNRDGKVQWRLELHGTQGRSAIEFYPGNALVKDSHGCILVGNSVSHAAGGPTLSGSRDAMSAFVQTIFGEGGGARNPSAWSKMVSELNIQRGPIHE